MYNRSQLKVAIWIWCQRICDEIGKEPTTRPRKLSVPIGDSARLRLWYKKSTMKRPQHKHNVTHISRCTHRRDRAAGDTGNAGDGAFERHNPRLCFDERILHRWRRRIRIICSNTTKSILMIHYLHLNAIRVSTIVNCFNKPKKKVTECLQ